MKKRPLLLIVDDEPFNVDVLEQELEELDLDTISAANGQEALERVAEAEPDMILLDIMMPIMDGFSVLEKLKANKKWRDIPVLVISAMSDMDSIVRGIKLGAEDYLPKPFDEILLDARVSASLEKKRLRDQEVEYLRQVDHLTEAAVAVEQDGFEEEMLAGVAAREDALGNLGRVFLRMAQEIHARERRLRMQIEQLQADVEEKLAGEHETALAYMPIDRRVAMARGESLPDYAMGAVLIADVAGFTTLTEHLARSLGWQRGAEEMTRLVNQLFSSLIERVHDYGGSVVNFAGDAITCWFAQDSPAGPASANRPRRRSRRR